MSTVRTTGAELQQLAVAGRGLLHRPLVSTHFDALTNSAPVALANFTRPQAPSCLDVRDRVDTLPLGMAAHLPRHVRVGAYQCTAPYVSRLQWQCAGAPLAFDGHWRTVQLDLPYGAGVYLPTAQSSHAGWPRLR